MMTVKKRTPTQYALEVKGRCLAPAMRIIDNLDEIEQFMVMANIPCENWSIDERFGMVYIDGFGAIRIGQYAVVDDENCNLKVFDNISDLQKEYEVVY